MTKQQGDFLKRNWLTFANVIALIGVLITATEWKSNIESRVTNLEVYTNKHQTDKSMHMTFERKIEVFVPRVEIDAKFQNLKDTQEETKEMVKEILKKL